MKTWKLSLLFLGLVAAVTIGLKLPKPKGPQVWAEGQMHGFAAPYTLPSQLKWNANATGSTTRTLAAKVGDVVAAADFSGTDICDKINKAINALPLDGGIVDATSFFSGQACASNPFAGIANKPVFLKLGMATLLITASWQISTPGVTIQGSSRSGGVGGFGTVLKWTGASGGGPIVKFVSAAAHYGTITDVSFDANALANVALHIEVLSGQALKHPHMERLEFYGYRTRGLVLGADDTGTLRNGQLEVATALDLTFRGGGIANTIGLLHNAQNDEHFNCLGCYFDPNPASYFDHDYAIWNQGGTVDVFGLSTTRSDVAAVQANDTVNIYNWRSEDNVLVNTSHSPFISPWLMESVFHNNFLAPGVTTSGTPGSTTWTYQIVAKTGATVVATTPGGTVTTGNGTLTGVNFNVITWSAPTVGSGYNYDIYRTAVGTSPTTTGLIGNTSSLTFNDTGLAGDSAATAATTVMTINTISTPVVINSAVIGGNIVLGSTDPVALALHAVKFLAGGVVHNGPQNQTLIESDALSALFKVKGTAPQLRLQNQSSQSVNSTINSNQQWSHDSSVVVPGVASNFGFGVGTSGALVAPIQVDQGASSSVGALFRGVNDISVFLDSAAANQALMIFRAAGAKRWELGKNYLGPNNDFRIARDTGTAGAEVVTDVVSITNANGIFTHLSGMATTRVVLTYGTTIATNASLGNTFSITATDGVAFTISDPTNPTTGQRITYIIRNTSGGALGAITWGASFKQAALTSPLTGNSRSREFLYDGTNWVLINQIGADVPN